jgi:hypothetical protein
MAGSGRCAYRSGRPRTTVILPDAGWQASRKFGFREAGLDTAAVSGDATAGGRCPAGRSDARMGRKMDGRNMHRSFGRRRKFGTRDRPPSFCRFADLLDRIARNRTGVFRMIGAETNPPIWNVEAPQISSRRGGPESNNDTDHAGGERDTDSNSHVAAASRASDSYFRSVGIRDGRIRAVCPPVRATANNRDSTRCGMAGKQKIWIPRGRVGCRRGGR